MSEVPTETWREQAASPPDRQQILRARAEALARPLVEDTRGPAAEDVLVFTLGDERYAAAARHVLEVVPLRGLTPVPATPPVIQGIMLHRGRILAVIDLRPLFGRERAAQPVGHVVVARAGEALLGILATSIEGVRPTDLDNLSVPPSSLETHATVLRGLTDELAGLLDLESLARDSRIRVEDDV